MSLFKAGEKVGNSLFHFSAEGDNVPFVVVGCLVILGCVLLSGNGGKNEHSKSRQ